MVIFCFKKTGARIKEVAISIYQAEQELFTHLLTLAALIFLIFGATYADSYFKPRLAAATQSLASKTDSRSVKITPAEAKNSQVNSSNSNVTSPPPPAQPQPAPPAPAPNLPPPLTQNTHNLNPVLLSRFDAFRTFIFQKYGVVLEIKSGWRSYEEQLQLFRSLPRGYANPPGRSNHEKGEAIDYTPYSQQYNQHLAQFGLRLPFPGKENWHIERVEPH